MRGMVRLGFMVLLALWFFPFEVVPDLKDPIRDAAGEAAWTMVAEVTGPTLAAQAWARGDGIVPSVIAGIVLATAWTLSHVTGDAAGARGVGGAAGVETVPAEAARATTSRTVRGLVDDVEFTQTWVGTDALFVVTVTHPTPSGMQTSVAPLTAAPGSAPVRGGSVMVTSTPTTPEVQLSVDPHGRKDPDGSVRYAVPGPLPTFPDPADWR